MVTLTSCSQNLLYGVYESKEGSILALKKNKTFHYLKSNDKVVSDVISLGYEYEAYGKFKEKDGMLYLISEELKLKDNPERNISLKVKEIDKELDRNWNDSVSVTVNYDKNFITVYLCNTFNEVNLNWEDNSNCYKLTEINKVKGFYENYFLRVYPNLESFKIRSATKINTIYFDSDYLDKEIENDLEIDISFDKRNFGLVFFNNELMLIKNHKIYHEGQELILKNNEERN